MHGTVQYITNCTMYNVVGYLYLFHMHSVQQLIQLDNNVIYCQKE